MKKTQVLKFQPMAFPSSLISHGFEHGRISICPPFCLLWLMPKAATSKSYWNENMIWWPALSSFSRQVCRRSSVRGCRGQVCTSSASPCPSAPGYQLVHKTRYKHCRVRFPEVSEDVWNRVAAFPSRSVLMTGGFTDLQRQLCLFTICCAPPVHSGLRKTSTALGSSLPAGTSEPWTGWMLTLLGQLSGSSQSEKHEKEEGNRTSGKYNRYRTAFRDQNLIQKSLQSQVGQGDNWFHSFSNQYNSWAGLDPDNQSGQHH